MCLLYFIVFDVRSCRGGFACGMGRLGLSSRSRCRGFVLWTFQIGVGRAGGIVLTSRELLGRGQEVRSHGGHRTEGYFLTLAGKAKANA